jgi:mannose-6-phosphate isomerase-like protein (cupin superfamily)
MVDGTTSSPGDGAVVAPRLNYVAEPVDDRGVALHLFAVSNTAPGAPISASRFSIEPGCGTSEDKHAVHEIWFVAQGRLAVFYDGAEYAVSSGDAVYFEPGKVHCSRNRGDVPALIFSTWWS